MSKRNDRWVSVAKVYWLQSRNIVRSKPSSKRDELTVMLVNGWNIVNGSIPVEDISKISTEESQDYVSLCLAERQAEWDSLKASSDPQDIINLEVFQRLFTKNNELIKPEYLANACYQRGAIYFQSQVLRFKRVQAKSLEESLNSAPDVDNLKPIPPEGEPVLFLDVPIVIRDYQTSAERLAESLWENESKLQGSEQISDEDRIRNALSLFESGYRDRDFRKIWPIGMAQKLFNICRANRLRPSLHLIERLLLPEGQPTKIRFGPLAAPEMIRLNRRLENQELKPNEIPATPDEFDAYFNESKGHSNAPKILKREDIRTIATQSPAKVIQEITECILNPKRDYKRVLKAHADLAKGYNLLGELKRLGQLDEAMRLLTKLHDKAALSQP